MIVCNPFTGQVINVNPEGHNQYWNPDGVAGHDRVSRLVNDMTKFRETPRFTKPQKRLVKKAYKAGISLYGPSRGGAWDSQGSGLSFGVKGGIIALPKKQFAEETGPDPRDEYYDEYPEEEKGGRFGSWSYGFDPDTGEGFEIADQPLERVLKKNQSKVKGSKLYTYDGEGGLITIIDLEDTRK